MILTFHYQELVQNGTWATVPREQVLVEGIHFSLNARNGQITLLPHAFWDSESTWRAGDRTEPLLYKGQVKHPQRISSGFEYYAPESVEVVAQLDGLGAPGRSVITKINDVAVIMDLEEVDTEAQTRLGYSVPKYMEAVTDG